MGTREEELDGGTIFCGRVVGFWPLEVALEILQPAPVLTVQKLGLDSVWLPKIACEKREKGKTNSVDMPFMACWCAKGLVCYSPGGGQKAKGTCSNYARRTFSLIVPVLREN